MKAEADDGGDDGRVEMNDDQASPTASAATADKRREDMIRAALDVIVERGDDTTLGVLLQNETAVLSRRSAETVVDRASVNPDLHAAVVNRHNLPVDLLNEMYFVVEAKLRETITARKQQGK